MSTPKTTETVDEVLGKEMLQYILNQLSGKIIAGCCGCSSNLSNYPTKTEIETALTTILGEFSLTNDSTTITLCKSLLTSLDPLEIEDKYDIIQFKTIAKESLLGEGDITFKTINGTSLLGEGNIVISGDGTVIDLSNYVKFTDVATTSKAGVMSETDKTYLDLLNNYIVESNTNKDYKIPLDALAKFFGEFFNNNVALTSDSSALGDDKNYYENAEFLYFWDVDGTTALFNGARIAMNYANSKHAGLMSSADKIALDNLQEVLPSCGNSMSTLVDDGWVTWGVTTTYSKLVPICQTESKLFVKVLLRENESQSMCVTRSTDGENFSFVGNIYENYQTQQIDSQSNITEYHNWEGIIVFDGYRDDDMNFHITGPYYKIVYAEDIGR